MKTRSNRKKQSQTRKVRTPSVKILSVGASLYGAKKYRGDEILEFTRERELKKKMPCLLDNVSFLGDLTQARGYITKDTILSKWNVKSPIRLLNLNRTNETFFRDLFLNNTSVRLVSAVKLSADALQHIKYEHKYLSMTLHERAFYEFCFAFGFIDVDEQYSFMKLLVYLIKNELIDIERRVHTSILNEVRKRILLYKLTHKIFRTDKYNRLSFYNIDRPIMLNICKLIHANHTNIDGCSYKKNKSFWVYNNKSLHEVILFNPHHHLIFDKVVE